MNGLDRSTATGGRARGAGRDDGERDQEWEPDRPAGVRPAIRGPRAVRRRERTPGQVGAAIGCGGASVAGLTVLAVLAAGVLSVANSCGAMFRPACESSDDLQRAAYHGDVGAVRRALAAGDDPQGQDRNGATPLSCAADAGRTETAVVLVEAGATGRGLSAERQTNLFTPAIARDDLAPVVLFLDHGFDVHAATDERSMITAVRANARRVLPELVRRGGSPDVALRAAITDAAPSVPISWFFGGQSAVTVPPSAALGVRLALTDVLLDLGADAGDHETMVAAASAADPGFMVRLLDRGADANAGDGAPLSHAASTGSAEIVRVLLAHGADPNLATTGPSALLWATVWAHHDIVDQLLAAHADPNFGGHVSRTDGDLAIGLASQGQPAAATAYVRQAFATFVEGGNVPPMIAAATFDHWDEAAKLLAAGADPNARAGSLSAVGAAAALNHPTTLRLLLDAGASPQSPDPTVPDPVVIAGQVGATEAVALLRAPR